MNGKENKTSLGDRSVASNSDFLRPELSVPTPMINALTEYHLSKRIWNARSDINVSSGSGSSCAGNVNFMELIIFSIICTIVIRILR